MLNPQFPWTCAIVCLLLAVSCSNDPEPQVGGTPDAAGDTGAQTDTGPGAMSDAGDVTADQGTPDSGDAGAQSAPLIHEAGLCAEATAELGGVSRGSDLMKVTLDAPTAVCNDGSPAVMYVRPAPAGSTNVDRWVLWLESGGGCNSAAACQRRWCGSTIGKMSSRFAPDGIRGVGIFEDRADNDFADWNHVVAYYCSSDTWSGRQRTLAVDPEGALPDYELYVHGAYILDEIINALQAGAVSDDGAMTMPSLDQASTFLMTGSSAGSGGVRSNADRIGDLLRQTNPSVDYRIVADAGFYPVDPHPPELTEADALELLDFKHEVFVNWRDGATDASCLEFHADDPRWCSDNSHLMSHHITTPAFVKQDLRDGAPGAYADAQTYSAILFEWFSSVAGNTHIPEETNVSFDNVGLFAPSCDHHLNLNTDSFYDVRVTNGTDELAMHDLLGNWVRGTEPFRAFHGGPLTSVCP